MKTAISSNELVQRLLAQQDGKCFICQKEIDLQTDSVEVDHIIPRARGGKDDDNKDAATHEWCNRTKSDSDLRVARCLAKYEEIKDKCAADDPKRPHLGDFLTEFGGGKFSPHVAQVDKTLSVSLSEMGQPPTKHSIYKDKLSGFDYTFLTLPIEYLHHDDRINPRAVGGGIRGLLTEFLAGRPQLHVSLAWGVIENGLMQLKVFDGQHKAVAQMLLGARELPLRLFIVHNADHDLKALLEANTNAGTSLRQVAFDQATQRYLGSQLYWEKIDEFRTSNNRAGDDLSFSEQDLLNFLRGERREVMKYILDDVRIGIIHHPENKLKDFVEFSGKEGEKPLSYSTIEKTAFSLFINKKPLSLPLSYRLEVAENPRQLEKEQVVRLLNVLAEKIYIGKYDFDLGSNKLEERLRKGEMIPEPHLRAVRLSREEVLFNVLRYVRDLVKQYFLMQGRVIEDAELFEQKFPEELWGLLSKLVQSVANLPVWVNKQLSGTIFGGKQDHEYWKVIFESGHDRGGVAVLAKPLNLKDLIS
jgi:hypothetical protein